MLNDETPDIAPRDAAGNKISPEMLAYDAFLADPEGQYGNVSNKPKDDPERKRVIKKIRSQGGF